MPANPNTPIVAATDSLGRAMPIWALGTATQFELTAGAPSDNIGPFDDACVVRVVSLAAVRISQAEAPEEDPEDYVAAETDTILPANHVEYLHVRAGEMVAVTRDSDDATGTFTILR